MKKYLVLTASIALLAGCSKQGQGNYGDTQTGSSSSQPAPSSTVRDAAGTNYTTSGYVTSANRSSDARTESPTTGSVSTPDGTPLDRALVHSVQTTLNSGEISGLSAAEASAIQVTADRGVVTLRGRVANEAEKQAVTDRIQKLNGVTIVKNEIIVGAEPQNQGNPATDQSGRDQSKRD